MNGSGNDRGICYLIGAGPGDPGLITVRGAECLKQADIVYYDALCAPELLALVPACAERIYVGKRAAEHALPQQEICRKLCEDVAAGKIVARLKGGDPYLFGRGGEEALALSEAGLRFEIVPGVTSAIAASAYAGIPVTHRNCATGVTFVTGHESDGKNADDPSAVDWVLLAKLNHTICIYMGMSRLRQICAALMAGGVEAGRPVGVVQWGTTARQRMTTGTLETIADVCEKEGLAAPAMIVVGNVVDFHDKLNWFMKRPLFGKKVLVTRARAQASDLGDMLSRHGADVAELPAIRIEPVEVKATANVISQIKNRQPLSEDDLVSCDTVTAALIKIMGMRTGDGTESQNPDWVVFTSANGVNIVFSRMDWFGLDARVFAGVKVAAIGTGTAKSLKEKGIFADLVPDAFTGEGLFDALQMREQTLGGMTVMLLRADLGREALPNLLREKGVAVDDIVIYRTMEEIVAEEEIAAALDGIRCITFASSGTVRNFVKQVGVRLSSLTEGENRPRFVSIGPITSNTMRELQLPVDAEAAPHTLSALVDSVINSLS